jgi:quercetin dioxygenase-like cupin family protein
MFNFKKLIVAIFVSSIALTCAVSAEEITSSRTELKKADLTGTNMEVIISVVEAKPGAGLARHIHPGEEAYYVLEGATLELPDGKQVPIPTGTASINMRDVPHAGFKVVGDKTLKLLTVHVVDKGKPMTEVVK